MTTPAAFFAALRQEVSDFLTAMPLAFAFDNAQLDAPNPPGLWAQIHLVISNSETIEIGDPTTNRHYGWLQVNVHTPKADGDGAALTVREAIASKYQVRNALGGTFEGETDRPPGYGSGPEWITPVRCHFYFDESVPIT